MEVRTYGHMDGRTEFLPILQDFVPSPGRCSKSMAALVYALSSPAPFGTKNLQCFGRQKQRQVVSNAFCTGKVSNTRIFESVRKSVFLDASSHLYNRRLVGPSVRHSVTLQKQGKINIQE